MNWFVLIGVLIIDKSMREGWLFWTSLGPSEGKILAIEDVVSQSTLNTNKNDKFLRNFEKNLF